MIVNSNGCKCIVAFALAVEPRFASRFSKNVSIVPLIGEGKACSIAESKSRSDALMTFLLALAEKLMEITLGTQDESRKAASAGSIEC